MANGQEKIRNDIDAVVDEITALGEGSPDYYEAMGYLSTVLARRQWSLAERLRRRAETRKHRAAVKAVTPLSGTRTRKKPGPKPRRSVETPAVQ